MVELAALEQVDAIVVGSGISGGWAAKELSEKGLNVLMLERGKPLTHGTDYVGEHQPPWQRPNMGMRPRELYDREYPCSRHPMPLMKPRGTFGITIKTIPTTITLMSPFIGSGGCCWRALAVVGAPELSLERFRFCCE